MKKTYTIQSSHSTIISPAKGAINWSLIDERGHERRVTAMANFDHNGEIIAVQPIYRRETPLVEALAKHVDGDTLTIDFTAFNTANGYINREIYADMRKCERMACIARRALRVLAVFTVIAVLWLAWTFSISVDKFSQQQPLKRHELP